MESWEERGIPLNIVIRSINSVFDVYDRQPPGTRVIKGVTFCVDEIEAQFAEWSRSQAGKGESPGESVGEFSLSAISDHIRLSMERLNQVTSDFLAEDVRRAIDRLGELLLQISEQPEIVDGILSDIEKLLERAMLTNWPKPHLKLLEKETAAQLKAYKADMEPEAYKNTYDLMLLKRLREEAGVPRLGLFYL